MPTDSGQPPFPPAIPRHPPLPPLPSRMLHCGLSFLPGPPHGGDPSATIDQCTVPRYARGRRIQGCGGGHGPANTCCLVIQPLSCRLWLHLPAS